LEVEERKNTLEEIEQYLAVKTLYTNKHIITASLERIINSFQASVQPGQQLTDQVFTVSGLRQYYCISLSYSGRITSKRESSKKLLFYTIEQNGHPLQIMCNLRHYNGTEEQFNFLHQNMRRGDIIGTLTEMASNFRKLQKDLLVKPKLEN
jgi:lysyl-tRNA synthetase class II